MLEQFYWFAHHLIYAHCVVCPTIKRVAVLQGKRVSLRFLAAAVIRNEWGPLERRRPCFPESTQQAELGKAPGILGRMRPATPWRCWEAGEKGEGRRGRCLLAAQGSPGPSPRADCKEETFLEMQRWLCTVCSIQEATGEELDRKTQWERLPHPTESAREGTRFCAK